MAIGDKQREVIKIIESILGEKSQNKTFNWLINKHKNDIFKHYYEVIDRIFSELGGDKTGLNAKRKVKLKPDCYFGGCYNFLFEFDEIQHFTEYKLLALQHYPIESRKGFDYDGYIDWCNKYKFEALKKGPAGYRKPKPEFPFENGRAAQRAYFDSFRDILPTLYGLNVTIRISEFEIGCGGSSESSPDRKAIEDILKKCEII